jgi:hypothetical protein
MGVLSQALEIIFEVQMKKSNEKIASRQVSFFPIHKTRFFFLFFLLFGPFVLLKLLTFSFHAHFKVS